MPAPVYLISRAADPVFALFIGLSAAATRINREEKDLGRSTKDTIDAGFRYLYPELRSLAFTSLKLTQLSRRIGLPRAGDVIAKKN